MIPFCCSGTVAHCQPILDGGGRRGPVVWEWLLTVVSGQAKINCVFLAFLVAVDVRFEVQLQKSSASIDGSSRRPSELGCLVWPW